MDATADMLWNDNKCTGRLSYICAYYVSGNPVPMPTAPTTGGGCPNGGEWIKFGGWCYKFNTARGLTGNTYEQVWLLFKLYLSTRRNYKSTFLDNRKRSFSKMQTRSSGS